MVSRRSYRLLFATVIVVSALFLAGSYYSYHQAPAPKQAQATVSGSTPSNLTVVSTAPRKFVGGQLIAYTDQGEIYYRNTTYDKYYGIEPSPVGRTTVLYVAGTELKANECFGGTSCRRVVVERVNLTTGSVTRVFSRYAPRSIWHDVERLDGSRLLVGDMDRNQVYVVNTTNGVITWIWSAQAGFSVNNGGIYPNDWTHLNDVEQLSDGRIMVSVRNHDQVVFINERSRIDSNWTLGADGDHDTLYEQHNPDYIPRTRGGPALLVADSENNRVVEYQRSSRGTWRQVWAWQDATLQWPRDADRLPSGHTLITDSNGNRIIEVNESGAIVWKIAVDTPYEAERLGTGPGSSGGHAAMQLGLQSTTVSGGSSGETSGGIFQWAWLIVRDIIPGPLVNGALFVLPRWVEGKNLLQLFLLGTTTAGWTVVELRWSAYTLRSPILKSSEKRG